MSKKENTTGYDRGEVNKSGYDRGELNKSGYDRGEVNKSGYDRGELNKSAYETKAGAVMSEPIKGTSSNGESEKSSYKKTMNEKENKSSYEYCCLMLRCDISDWNEILNSVPDKHVYNVKGDSTYGKVEDTHLTVLYGFHNKEDFSKIKKFIEEKDYKNFTLKITGVSCFKNDDFSVYKFDVHCDKLNKLNKELRDNFEHTSTFKDYNPHITISYIKPEYHNLYDKKIIFEKPFTINVNEYIYSMTDGNKKTFKIENNMKKNNNKKIMKEEYSFENNPRPKNLPQITAPFYFVVRNLEDLGVPFETIQVKVNKLIPSQDYVNTGTLHSIQKSVRDGYDIDPIFISGDNHICDGHHRSAAMLEELGKEKAKIKAFRIKVPQNEANQILGRIQDRYDLLGDEEDTSYPEFDEIVEKLKL